jgi:tetratricopeptide (TPR) repeat protein
VVVFRDDAALTPFKPRARGKPNDDVAGYFTSLPHANYIVLAPSGYRPFTYQLIFHEYTHYIIARNFKRLPFWLNEGLSEFYSTFAGSDRDARTIVGRPIDWHLATLLQRGVMPHARFVQPQIPEELLRDQQGMARLYAQSWALTHFLLVGGDEARRQQLGKYLAALERGTPNDKAFEEIFGPDLGVLDRQLEKHVSDFRMKAVQLQLAPMPLQLQATPLREVEAEYVQGDLLVNTGASELADRYLSNALKLDAAHAPARLARAALHLQGERYAEALDLASAEDLNAASEARGPFVRAEALRALERHTDATAAYKTVLALRPDAAYAEYGLSLSQQASSDPGAAASFERCMALSPEPGWYLRRQRDAMRMALDDFIVSDTRKYLDSAGWPADGGAYVMLPAVIALLRAGASDEALQAIGEIEAHVQPDSWQAALVSFFRGQLSADALVARAKRDEGLLTEAHAYAGILANIAGDRPAALTHLGWVEKHGRKDFIEYGFALGERRRIQRRAE